MIEFEKLPENIAEGDVQKITLEGEFIKQLLKVFPRSRIKSHGHEEGQWEVWVITESNILCICMPGEQHSIVNKTNKTIRVKSIKGKGKYTYEELAFFFKESYKEEDKEMIILRGTIEFG